MAVKMLHGWDRMLRPSWLRSDGTSGVANKGGQHDTARRQRVDFGSGRVDSLHHPPVAT